METLSTVVESAGPAIGFFLALVAFFVLWMLARRNGQPPVRMMLFVFGALLGWTVGILITPEKSQEGAFSAYGTAIMTFITGFLVAKIDRIFEVKIEGNPNFVNGEFVFRVLLGGSAFVLGVLCTFIWRTYVSGVAGA